MAINRTGQWLYGVGFAVILPAALAAWAHAVEGSIRIALQPSLTLGLPAAAVGAGLLLLGMLHLFIHGGGLPMNAFPPPKYVANGVYRWLPHPIYTGFVILVAGISIATGSAAGLWFITPVVAMGCLALVLGYERHDLAKRFGRPARTLLPLPGSGSCSPYDRLACYLFVFVPWVVLYQAVIALGLPSGLATTQLPFERNLPVIEWAEIFCFSAYGITALAPLLARDRTSLRTFCMRALCAMIVVFPIYLFFPLAAPLRPFTPHTLFGHLLAWERTLDSAAGAFPSFRVIWAVLAAELLAGGSARRGSWRVWLCRGWAALVAAACIATGQHSIADVLAGYATVVLVVYIPASWRFTITQAERIANSWREWRIGPLRIINHGFFAGAAGGLALWIAASFVGPRGQPPILLAALAAVAGAALWAQFVEGSPALLRPFGFYGGLLGGTLGALAAPLFRTSPWLVLAAFSAGGPWAQAIGRLRCLVQGCCHGRPAPAPLGIRYHHPLSRVCKMTPWAGVPLYPTPIYSILWNLFIATVISRLWFLRSDLHLIAGLYFILTGLGRFVEEAWRGEPQTPTFANLRLYQWAAIASVVLGAVMTALGSSSPAPLPDFNWAWVLPSAAFGVLVAFSMGVDFPASHRRFSRLA